MTMIVFALLIAIAIVAFTYAALRRRRRSERRRQRRNRHLAHQRAWDMVFKRGERPKRLTDGRDRQR